MSGEPPFRIIATIDCGPLCNHVALVDNANGKFAYVTVGAENLVKVFRRDHGPKLIATILTGDLPHGVWGSDDGTRVYVGLENQDAVVAIDALANKIIASIPVGQQPQALVYVPEAVPKGEGTANLSQLGSSGAALHLTLTSPDRGGDSPQGTVSVNALGALDLLQAAVSGLKPQRKYTLWLCNSRTTPFEQKEALVTFQPNLAGAQIAQAIGPFRSQVSSVNESPERQRFLMVAEFESDTPVLIQASPEGQNAKTKAK
jgi:YVTN family beta-propeller protein